jgi:hypothetical protein
MSAKLAGNNLPFWLLAHVSSLNNRLLHDDIALVLITLSLSRTSQRCLFYSFENTCCCVGVHLIFRLTEYIRFFLTKEKNKT